MSTAVTEREHRDCGRKTSTAGTEGEESRRDCAEKMSTATTEGEHRDCGRKTSTAGTEGEECRRDCVEKMTDGKKQQESSTERTNAHEKEEDMHMRLTSDGDERKNRDNNNKYAPTVLSYGDHLEEVTVRTLGIKNLDVEELLEREVPVRLFSGTSMKTSDYEEICREDFPLLYRRIVAQVLWKFLRLRPISSSDEVQVIFSVLSSHHRREIPSFNRSQRRVSVLADQEGTSLGQAETNGVHARSPSLAASLAKSHTREVPSHGVHARSPESVTSGVPCQVAHEGSSRYQADTNGVLALYPPLAVFLAKSHTREVPSTSTRPTPAVFQREVCAGRLRPTRAYCQVCLEGTSLAESTRKGTLSDVKHADTSGVCDDLVRQKGLRRDPGKVNIQYRIDMSRVVLNLAFRSLTWCRSLLQKREITLKPTLSGVGLFLQQIISTDLARARGNLIAFIQHSRNAVLDPEGPQKSPQWQNFSLRASWAGPTPV
ncbi:hypothetical protein Bbelb_055220 [Branchiostoma belcheri]|nr:hypothetical protein Bbelb_055220 [Branchiostoma belcheri]